MKKSHLILLFLLLPFVNMAQEDDDIKWYLNLPEIPIYADRPIKEIGVQQTKMDSIVLKENIALSVADILTFSSPIFVKNYGRATLSHNSCRQLRNHQLGGYCQFT